MDLQTIINSLLEGDNFRTTSQELAFNLEQELIDQQLVYCKWSNYYDGIRHFEFNL